MSFTNKLENMFIVHAMWWCKDPIVVVPNLELPNTNKNELRALFERQSNSHATIPAEHVHVH